MKATIRVCRRVSSAAFGAFAQENSVISCEVHELHLQDHRAVGGVSPRDNTEPRDRTRLARVHELHLAGALQTAVDFQENQGGQVSAGNPSPWLYSGSVWE